MGSEKSGSKEIPGCDVASRTSSAKNLGGVAVHLYPGLPSFPLRMLIGTVFFFFF